MDINWCYLFFTKFFLFSITGENGQPVMIEKEKLFPEERKKYDQGWMHNAFNQYASDKISLHRSLPDVRDEE